jgi:hypothetical protein
MFEPFPLSCDLIPIPGRATTLFEISLFSYYTIDVFDDRFGDGDDFDYVAIDFAQDNGRVICPSVELELLTPLPTVIAVS